MAKNSRSKRARRHRQLQKQRLPTASSEYQVTCEALKSLFSRYHPIDVALSLSVSDLWLPNIASQVKHAFAFANFVSMPINGFARSVKIDSFEEYKVFIEAVRKELPSFPTLEDYVPELDWGEIRHLWHDRIFRIFYGGAVERISDFITAFALVHKDSAGAAADMYLALLAQDHERLRILLGWPAPQSGSDRIIDELYVSRDIYWWMRNPPYRVEAHFVRVDALEGWLRAQHLLQ